MDDVAATDRTAYHLSPAPVGAVNESPSGVAISADKTTVTLGFDNPLTANTSYQLVIDPNVTDCSGNALSPRNGDNQIVVDPHYELYLLSFDNTAWKYNHEGTDLGVDWRVDPGYDDSTWSNGVSVFDAKTAPRTTVGGMTVRTQLPLHYGPYTSDDVPVYYFRTHFTFASTPDKVVSLGLRTFVDDFDDAWMNGYGAPVHTNLNNPLTDLDSYGYSGGTAVGDAAILPTTGAYSINPTNLVTGDNLIAVKLFQQALGSSDITFSYELTAVVTGFVSVGPRLSISYDGSLVTVTWPDSGEQLYEATSVDGPWSPVGSGGSYQAAASGGARFYTLRQ